MMGNGKLSSGKLARGREAKLWQIIFVHKRRDPPGESEKEGGLT